MKMLSHMAAKEPDTHRGVVLSIVNRGHDTWFCLADVSKRLGCGGVVVVGRGGGGGKGV